LITEKYGKIIKGLGGLYTARVEQDGEVVLYTCRAKGSLHRDEEKLLVGDNVTLTIDDSTPDGIVISEIAERKNALIRPPMANLDYIFISFAAAKPAPVLETVDKLISIAEYNSITPVVIITKADLDPEYARELISIYSGAGIESFVTSSLSGEGIEELRGFVGECVVNGKTAAFAGASGVGKSTLMNAIFPSLALETAEISKKIERGRHTTRHVELYAVSDGEGSGFLADTPGFSLIDFQRFDFMPIEALFQTFREMLPYVGACRYVDCAHVGEGAEDCAVAAAAERGEISKSRLESYRAIYKVMKQKKSFG
jgi:ribosome biogenesis GTPase